MITKAFIILALGFVAPAWIIILIVVAVTGGCVDLLIGGCMSAALAALWIKGRGVTS